MASGSLAATLAREPSSTKKVENPTKAETKLTETFLNEKRWCFSQINPFSFQSFLHHDLNPLKLLDYSHYLL